MNQPLDFLTMFNAIESTTEVPERINLNPDNAIECAKLALNSQYDLAEALKLLEEEIGKLRQVVRGLTFDVVEAPQKDFQQSKLNRIGTELHNLAAMICLRLDRTQNARHHLASAMACNLNDQDTQFLYVEVYEKLSAYPEAFDQLNRTFGDVTIIDRFFRLFELCWNIQQTAPEQAYPLYEKLSNLEGAGILGVMSESQMSIIKNKEKRISSDDVQLLLKLGKQLRDNGKPIDALNSFSYVLASYPFHLGAWYFVGDIYLSFLIPAVEDREYTHLVIPENADLNDDQKKVLYYAIQAFQISLIGRPKDPYIYTLLVGCCIAMKDYKNAISYAEMVYRQEPGDPRVKGLYALTLVLNGDLSEAGELARQTIQQDPSENNALTTLERLYRLTAES